MTTPINLPTFNPTTAAQLEQGIAQALSGTARQWWTSNQAAMTGYVKSLAEAALQTQIALAGQTISAADAQTAMDMQKAALQQTIQYTEFMTLVLAQQLLDTVFSVIGWAIYNRTGINLYPALVHPPTGG